MAKKRKAKYGLRKDGKPKRKPGRKKGSTNSSGGAKKKRRGRPKGSTSGGSTGKIILELRCRKA